MDAHPIFSAVGESPHETIVLYLHTLTQNNCIILCVMFTVDCLYFTVQAGLWFHRTTIPTTPESTRIKILDAVHYEKI